jgi:hypothetical protein
MPTIKNDSWISFGQGVLKKEIEYRFINVMYILNIKKLINVLVEIPWKLTSGEKSNTEKDAVHL